MADLGVVPGANIFHPDPGAPAGKIFKSPNKEYIIGLYSELDMIYKKYNFKPFFSHSVLRNSLSNEFFNGWIK